MKFENTKINKIFEIEITKIHFFFNLQIFLKFFRFFKIFKISQKSFK